VSPTATWGASARRRTSSKRHGLRLEGTERAEIRDLRAWLVTTVARLALDALTSARARRAAPRAREAPSDLGKIIVVVRIAALYDIHGNLPALEAVLAEVPDDATILLGGDHVYGPFPAETLARLRALGKRAIWLRGNCDRELSEPCTGLPPSMSSTGFAAS
jgi:hypothetical protein